MEQRVRWVTTASGARIATAEAGEGPGLLYAAGWIGHLGLSWEPGAERAFHEALARGRRLVRYDREGCGLSAVAEQNSAPHAEGRAESSLAGEVELGPASSARRQAEPSLAGELEQLSAVAETLGAAPFDLVGSSLGALVAAAWAAEHPERVRRLVLYGAWVSGAAVSPASAQEHILGLVEQHWGIGSEVLTDIFAPDADTPTRQGFARYQRASSSAQTARALLALSYRIDIADVLGRVRSPMLVVHREQDRAAPLEQAQALAAGIAGARLVVLPGRSHLPSVGDSVGLVAEIRRFLGLRVARSTATGLTARQNEVAALVGAGLTNRAIAARLGIEERSAEGHVERIRLRLGLRSRAQIAAWYAAAHPD